MIDVPDRTGERPDTHYDIPHQQRSEIPDRALYDRMKTRFLDLGDAVIGASLISVPGAAALFLPEQSPCNCDAFMKGREFAHIHPPYDGSFHMNLSEADCEEVIARGWGELHPLAAAGKIPKNCVMIYAPRDDEDIEVILRIAEASQRYAAGVDDTI